MSRRLLTSPALALALGALALGGCGGGDDSDKAAGPIRTTTELTVIKGDKATDPADRVSVASGATIQIIVTALPAEPNKQLDGQPVTLRLPLKLDDALKVSSSGEQGTRSSTATIKVKGGGGKLVNIRWVCRVPPETFCPVEARSRAGSLELEFAARKQSPQLTVAAEIGS